MGPISEIKTFNNNFEKKYVCDDIENDIDFVEVSIKSSGIHRSQHQDSTHGFFRYCKPVANYQQKYHSHV